MMPPRIRFPIDERPLRNRTLLPAAGRKVVLTGGAEELAATAGLLLAFAPERRRAAVRNKLDTSSSVGSAAFDGATRATPGATSRTSCGSSACFGFTVGCMGAPCSVQYRPRSARTVDFPQIGDVLPRRHNSSPGLTKTRQYDGESGALTTMPLRELAFSPPPMQSCAPIVCHPRAPRRRAAS